MNVRRLVPVPLRGLRERLLRKVGLSAREERLDLDPTDKLASARVAEEMFRTRQAEYPFGTVERSRRLLRLIEGSFPTPFLTEQYFDNLDAVLRTRPKRDVPGNVLLGVGSGRSGSTSLTALLRTIEDSCCTHENPPLLDWSPQEAQVQFHLRRLGCLADHFAVVGDVSHWWLNVLDPFFERFPAGRVIGIMRDAEGCAKSFMRIKGQGRQSLNHWAPAGNAIWWAHGWDDTYPSYDLPAYADSQPDRAKYEMLVRYVQDYNALLEERAAHWGGRMVLIRTEQLGQPDIQRMILNIAGAPGRLLDRKFNVRTVAEGEVDELIY